METEMNPLLTKSPSSLSCINIAEDQDQHKYTSLKDILIFNPPPSPSSFGVHNIGHYCNGSLGNDNEFDSGGIPIKNELLKHAASVYLQSAAILANRNQNFMSRMWRRLRLLRRRMSTSSSWWDCLHGLFGFMGRSMGNALSCVTGYVGQSTSAFSQRPPLMCS